MAGEDKQLESPEQLVPFRSLPSSDPPSAPPSLPSTPQIPSFNLAASSPWRMFTSPPSSTSPSPVRPLSSTRSSVSTYGSFPTSARSSFSGEFPLPRSAAATAADQRPKRSLRDLEDLFFHAASHAAKAGDILFLECLLELPCRDRRQRYEEALAFAEVRKHTATQKNKKERMLLEKLDAFFKQHAGVERYAMENLQHLNLELSSAYAKHDQSALQDADAYLKARNIFRVPEKTFRIQFGEPQKKIGKKTRAENDSGQINSPAFGAYLREFRPMEVSGPARLDTLEDTLLSLDTPYKLQCYIQELRIRVADAEKADLDATENLGVIGLACLSYEQEEYLEIQEQEAREKEEKITALLNRESLPFVLQTLRCQNVEEARALLTRKYAVCPMADLQGDAALDAEAKDAPQDNPLDSEEKDALKENTLYVDVHTVVKEEIDEQGKKHIYILKYLKYQVRNPEGVGVEGLIAQDEFPCLIPDYLDLRMVKRNLKTILEITAQKGHTLPIASIPTFFKPEIGKQRKSIFATAQVMRAEKALAFLRARYAALGEFCQEIGQRTTDTEAQARLSWQDLEEAPRLRELALFYQPKPGASPGLKDNALTTFYYARAYVVSGDLRDKAAYLALYSHRETTELEKQMLFGKLLREDFSNPRLLELLRAHAFRPLAHVTEIWPIDKPLMAYALEYPVNELFFLQPSTTACLQADQRMLVSIIGEPKVSQGFKKTAVELYVACYGGQYLDAKHLNPRSTIARQIGFHLREAVYTALQGPMGEQVLWNGSEKKSLDALAALQGCSRRRAIAHIRQYSALANALREQSTFLPQPIQDAIQTALLQSDGMQSFYKIEAFFDEVLALSPELRLPLQDEMYAKLDGQWLYFTRSKTQTERAHGFSALAEIFQVRSAQAMRNIFTGWLLQNKDQPAVKQCVLDEMMAIVLGITGEGKEQEQPIEGTEHLCKTFRAQCQARTAFLQGARQKYPELRACDNAACIVSIKTDEKYSSLLQRYLLIEQQAAKLEVEVRACCEREDVRIAYLYSFKLDRRLGISTAVLFAQQHHVGLYVLGQHLQLLAAPSLMQGDQEQAQEEYKQVEAAAEPEAEVKAEEGVPAQQHARAYLLFTEGHYDHLIVQSAWADLPIREEVIELKEAEEEAKKEEMDLEARKGCLALCLACFRYVYSKVSGQADREQRLEYNRVIYFLEQLKQNIAVQPAILNTLRAVLARPIFFAHDKPSVIAIQHVMLLKLLPEPKEETKITYENYLEMNPRYVFEEMEKNLEHYLSTLLSAASKKYKKVFQELMDLKASLVQQEMSAAPSCFQALYRSRMASTQASIIRAMEKIHALIAMHAQEVIPPGLETLLQFDALLRIHDRVKAVKKLKRSFDQVDAMGMDPYTLMVREKSMWEDLEIVLPPIGASLRDRTTPASDVHAALYGSLHMARRSSLLHGRLFAGTGSMAYDGLDRFYVIFCDEMKWMAVHPDHTKKQLKGIIQASGIEQLDVDSLDSIEEKIWELGSMFEIEEEEEEEEEKEEEKEDAVEPEEVVRDAQTMHMIQELVRRLCDRCHEQFALVDPPDYRRCAGFLSEIVFLYLCFDKQFSFERLLDWLDRGPVLYKSDGKKYEGPVLTLRTGKKITALQLIRRSGLCCWRKTADGSKKEFRYGMDTEVLRSDYEVLGCKKVLLESELDNLRNALDAARLLDRWYLHSRQAGWLDAKTRARYKYSVEETYAVMAETFTPKKGAREIEQELRTEIDRQAAAHQVVLAKCDAAYAQREQELKQQIAQLQRALEHEKGKTQETERQLEILHARVTSLMAEKERTAGVKRGGAETPPQRPSSCSPRFLGGEYCARPPLVAVIPLASRATREKAMDAAASPSTSSETEAVSPEGVFV